ncbi:S8 family peptidase [Streptomyces sp. TRM76323]|uniref:S8 family peptidase n=1 Tax=Streptomyces tamarix TaxID=3078565 RepID=A0ABU3QMD3_9ACTN|nr:S8 family peptidase [Streptomyces tamarix]MDT9683920.1 S8 family peptidase [Streptomyces tamarix]
MRLPARRASAALLLLLMPLAATPATAAGSDTEPPRTTPAPLRPAPADGIDGQYIVTLEPDATPAQVAQHAGVTPLFSYEKVVRGFAAKLTPAQLSTVRSAPGVAAVEQDAVVSTVPVPETRAPASSWGLDRIDQPFLPLNGQYNVKGTGAGVSAFILDTGIDYGHPEFTGRARPGFDAIGDGRNGRDCNGHGTHVAGTVGGATHGVARQVGLVSVRVLDCEGRGSFAGIIAGLEWVAVNSNRPSVLNASLGGPRSEVVNTATTVLSDKGVLPVVAAGNSSADACGVSPASAARTMTVGATNHLDQEASFSNFGPCLTIYAPGTQIKSAKLGGGSTHMSGTSMASPHVAGVAALYKQRHPTASSRAVAAWIVEQSVKDVLTVTKSSPNRLVQTGGL